MNKFVFAHSGAKLGDPNGGDSSAMMGPITDFSGEVPDTETRTVADQIASALMFLARKNIDPKAINLILLDGGINDVGVDKILNPLTSQSDLRSQIELFCHQHMSGMLKRALNEFPNAVIFVTGYYVIVSDQSDSTGLEVAAAAIIYMLFESLALLAGPEGAAAAPLALITGLILGNVAIGGIISNCNLFATESNKALGMAVDEATSAPNGMFGGSSLPRVMFIDPTSTQLPSHFSAGTAVYAGDNGDDRDPNHPTKSFLWGFSQSADELAVEIGGLTVAGGLLGCGLGALVGFLIGGPAGAAVGCEVGGAVGTAASAAGVTKGVIDHLEPVDEVITQRERFCDSSDVSCRCASVGHPNRQGEEVYGDAIIQQLGLFASVLLAGDISSSCMIATAAYGSSKAEEVQRLRRTRDKFLLKSKLFGDFFSTLLTEYYQFSPTVAFQMVKSPAVKQSISFLLVKPFLSFIELLQVWIKQQPNPRVSLMERRVRDAMAESLSDLDALGIRGEDVAATRDELLKLSTSPRRIPEALPSMVSDSTPRGIVSYLNAVIGQAAVGRGDYVEAALISPLEIYWSALEIYGRSGSASEASNHFWRMMERWLGSAPPIPRSFVALTPRAARRELTTLSKALFRKDEVRYVFGTRLLRRHKGKVEYRLKSLLQELDYLPRPKSRSASRKRR